MTTATTTFTSGTTTITSYLLATVGQGLWIISPPKVVPKLSAMVGAIRTDINPAMNPAIFVSFFDITVSSDNETRDIYLQYWIVQADGTEIFRNTVHLGNFLGSLTRTVEVPLPLGDYVIHGYAFSQTAESNHFSQAFTVSVPTVFLVLVVLVVVILVIAVILVRLRFRLFPDFFL